MRSSSHAYARVANDLREQILNGRLPAAGRLRAERELCREFDVSRITIRHALRILAEEGLLQRRLGSGTYVRPAATRRIPLMIDYTGSMRDHAPRLRRLLLSRRWAAPASDVAEALALPAGERVLVAERVDRQNDTAVAWDRACIAEPYARRLSRAHLQRVDFIEAWTRQARFGIDSCRQQIEAVAADAPTACHLALPPGHPVLKSTEVYYADARRAAGLFVSYYHPRWICITSRFRWKERKGP